MQPLSGKRFLVFVGDIYEDLELWYPKLRLIEAGAEVVVAGPETGRTYAGKNGYPCLSDAAIDDVTADGSRECHGRSVVNLNSIVVAPRKRTAVD